MHQIWRNKEYSDKIQAVYNHFKDEFSKIMYAFCGVIGEQSLLQKYPNIFFYSDLEIEFIYKGGGFKGSKNDRTSFLIKFPKVEIFNDQVYIPVGFSNREVIQKLYTKFLDNEFDFDGFRKSIEISVNKLVENYTDITSNNFELIRLNYFEDCNRKINEFEKAFFSIPSVLLTYKISEKIRSYGYKPGEGKNFTHSFSYNYIDVLDCKDDLVVKYIQSLNLSNPTSCYTDYLEMYPSKSGIVEDKEFYDLELSRKINWYIFINRNNGNRYSYNDIKNTVALDKDQNQEILFENLLIIYIIVTQNIDVISLFFKGLMHSENCSYKNLVLFSEYFLNKKYQGNEYIFLFF